MSQSYIFKKFILIQLVVVLCTGCAWLKGKEPEKPPEQLMSEGLSAFDDGDYTEAVESFQKLKDRYPYSKLAIQAELKLADALFRKKEFEEALEAYREFETLHPKNKSIPYVIYQEGMCNFLRMNSIDRDQTNTRNALEEFERLKREFPTNSFSFQAQRKIRECLVNLAEYEFYVGRFYFKAGHYLAALRRFEYLLTHYPDLGQYGKTLIYIARCKEKLADQDSPH